MARMPASMTNIVCCLGERADAGAGCAGAPAGSKPPVIDLANNRLRSNFILPRQLEQYCSKFPANAEVTSASWLPAAMGFLWAAYRGAIPPAGSVLGWDGTGG